MLLLILKVAKKICLENKISFSAVSYIGDDINCYGLLKSVNYKACPANARESIKKIDNILKLKTKGGDGAVREFVEYLIDKKLIWKVLFYQIL